MFILRIWQQFQLFTMYIYKNSSTQYYYVSEGHEKVKRRGKKTKIKKNW